MAMLVCMAVALFSCSKDEEEELDIETGIVGNWESTSADLLINGMSIDEFAKQIAQISDSSEEDIKEEYGIGELKSTYEFTEDNNFTETIEGEGTSKGTWKVGPNRMITLTYSQGHPSEFQVKSLKSNSATIVFVDTDSEMDNGQELDVKLEYYLYLKK